MSKRNDLQDTLMAIARTAISVGDVWNMDFEAYVDEILDTLGVEIVTTEEVRSK